jgi:dsDNA-specific endonuclease/ATPase MutS2
MKANDVVEVDLHVNEILESTAGMSAKDILDYQLKVFSDTMEKYKNDKGRRIVFIHGKGEGVLRNALLQELKSKYRRCTYQDASFREYGFGATMVKIG